MHMLYLVGGLEHVLFFHILGIIIPTDIYFRGVETTNQISIDSSEHSTTQFFNSKAMLHPEITQSGPSELGKEVARLSRVTGRKRHAAAMDFVVGKNRPLNMEGSDHSRKL